MNDNINKGFDQVAAFQKLWMDSFANMTSVWSQLCTGSPPSEEMRKMRGAMLKTLAETWDEYMRTPQFMEMMKASLNGALDLKRMSRDAMNRVHEQLENPSKEDIDGVLMATRHAERRLLDLLEGLDDRVAKLDEKLTRSISGSQSRRMPPNSGDRLQRPRPRNRRTHQTPANEHYHFS
jgi:hypothetical protein